MFAVRFIDEILSYFKAPTHPFWWGYLVIYIVLGFSIVWMRSKKTNNSLKMEWKRFLSDLFHESSLNDLKIFTARVLALTLVSVYFFDVRGSVRSIGTFIQEWAKESLFSLHISIDLQLLPKIFFTIMLLVCYDFFYYLSHRMFHRCSFLWSFHKVHHSALVLTPLTLGRGDVFSIFYFLFLAEFSRVSCVVLSWVIFGVQPGPILFFGAPLGLFLVSSFQQHFNHSSFWIHYGWFGNIFMSPACHKIHHSIDPQHHGKNLGLVFPWFDKLFGTYVEAAKERENMVYGIDGIEDIEFNKLGFFKMNIYPLIDLKRRFFNHSQK